MLRVEVKFKIGKVKAKKVLEVKNWEEVTHYLLTFLTMSKRLRVKIEVIP